MITGLLLSAATTLAWAQGGPPCPPTEDNPIQCPQKYMPKPIAPPSKEARDGVEFAIKTFSAARNAEKEAILELQKKPLPDPDGLALFIMHETSHWVDAAGSGGFKRSDRPSWKFLGEYRAYERQAELARVLGRDDSHEKGLSDQFIRQVLEMQRLKQTELGEDELRGLHPDWLFPGARRALSPEAESRSGGPEHLEHLKLEGELELLEAAQRAKLLQERLRLEHEEREKREREAAEEKALRERDPRWRLEQLAASFGFEFERWNERGEPVFFEKPLRPPFHRYTFPVQYWDDVPAALFLARSCLDGRVAASSAGALEILRDRGGDSKFRKRITPKYGENLAVDCIELLMLNPDYLGNLADIQEVIDADIERGKKSRERERKHPARGGASPEPELRGSREPRERDRGGADLSPADRALERGRRIKLP